jgi:hypothetical protein
MTGIHEPVAAQIPMQVGSVLRIKNSGEIIVSLVVIGAETVSR